MILDVSNEYEDLVGRYIASAVAEGRATPLWVYRFGKLEVFFEVIDDSSELSYIDRAEIHRNGIILSVMRYDKEALPKAGFWNTIDRAAAAMRAEMETELEESRRAVEKCQYALIEAQRVLDIRHEDIKQADRWAEKDRREGRQLMRYLGIDETALEKKRSAE